MSERTDEELMKAYQGGDEAAFQALYRRHAARVYGFLRSKTGDSAQADDVFQATFMKLHATRASYDPTFPFAPWLFAICRNALIDSLRGAKRNREAAAPNALDEAAAPEQAPESLPVSSLASLSQAQRAVIQLRYESDLSFEEIAKRLETTPANARQLASRSIRKLRSLFKKGAEE